MVRPRTREARRCSANSSTGCRNCTARRLRDARYIASPGCNATAAILGLYPLARAGVLDPAMPIVIESKTGSSGAGGESGLASHHPERSGVIRSFKPTGHRHSAEVIQELTVGWPRAADRACP